MAADEDDDLYDEEFDFVDDDPDDDDSSVTDDESDIDDSSPTEVVAEVTKEVAEEAAFEPAAPDDSDVVEEVAEEPSVPKVPTDHVVHIYESQKFHRTIDRPFTAEDAEAFASDYNRAAKAYARFAVAGKEDVKPKKTVALARPRDLSTD